MAKVVSEKTQRTFTVELSEDEARAILDHLPAWSWGEETTPATEVRSVLQNALDPPF